MTLDQFLRREGLSDAAFGAKCKPPITRSQIWTYRKRMHSPRAEKVAAIRKATGNLVNAEDLIPNGSR